MGMEQIEGKFGTGKGVVEELSVIKTLPELLHDVVRLIFDVDVLYLDQGLGGLQHGRVSGGGRLVVIAVVQQNLRLKGLPFTGGQAELGHGYYLAGTFTYTHIAEAILPGVAPVGIVASILGIRRHTR